MNRETFIRKLQAGLTGIPAAAKEDIVRDYEAHFADGAAQGRTEEEVAQALGDPARLARELRVEAGLQRWEEKPSPSNAIAAVLALIGLGAIDIILMLPLLMGLAGILLALFFTSIGVFVGGAAMLVFGPFHAPPGGPLAAVLVGIGMIASAVFLASVLTMVTIALVNAIVWYARLHYRAIRLTNPS
jgi:uncharacterized membrane protein